jgi:hypothetical protein
MPQVCFSPALTLRKVPDGGFVLPSLSLPQHLTLPLLVMPQTWKVPALMLSKVTDGMPLIWP